MWCLILNTGTVSKRFIDFMITQVIRFIQEQSLFLFHSKRLILSPNIVPICDLWVIMGFTQRDTGTCRHGNFILPLKNE